MDEDDVIYAWLLTVMGKAGHLDRAECLGWHYDGCAGRLWCSCGARLWKTAMVRAT